MPMTPHKTRRPAARALTIVALAALAGCAWVSETTDRVLPDRRADYKKARQVDSLEVPPDLTRSTADDALVVPDVSPSGIATYSEYASGRRGPGQARARGVLPKVEGVRVERDGDRRWLVVDDEPGRVWLRVRAFLTSQGYGIRREESAIGLIETDWIETRIDVPQGALRRLFGQMFGASNAAAVRDRFRIRIERGQGPATTEIYVTHFGVEEVYARDDSLDFDSAWQPRPRDPDLEAELLTRLMIYLGTERERARRMLAQANERRTEVRLGQDEEGRPALLVGEPFPQAWRLVGLALDRAGFMVEDRDRAAGVYYVRYADPYADAAGDRRKRGFLSRLAFWRREDRPSEAVTYQVQVASSGERTVVRVADVKGGPLGSDAAGRILKLLERQIR